MPCETALPVKHCPLYYRSSLPSPLHSQINAVRFLPTHSLLLAWPRSGKVAQRPATSRGVGRPLRLDGLSISIVGGKADAFWSTRMARPAPQPHCLRQRHSGISSSSSIRSPLTWPWLSWHSCANPVLGVSHRHRFWNRSGLLLMLSSSTRVSGAGAANG